MENCNRDVWSSELVTMSGPRRVCDTKVWRNENECHKGDESYLTEKEVRNNPIVE